ncbi:hypothetical protein ES288_D04G078800v1 [Gossypium darwinii]|uniref:Uncharacterized protein n=1 Tax=Gossypium darwinii TaxID=34276 RepID=A0A5D2CYW5_GOSDA|nr:hypothetical protein ES288_D04G078800v1 [Gossypium darwinii]
MEADDVDTPGSSTKESSLPTTSSSMPISSTTLKKILMTLISTKKTKKNRFNAGDDDYEGYNYRLCGRLSAVRIVFLCRFVQEITVYFMELATPHTEEVIKLVDKVGDFEWLIQKSEIDGAAALKLDLTFDTPIIIVLEIQRALSAAEEATAVFGEVALFVFKSSTCIMGQLAQICIFPVAEKTALLQPIELKLVPVALEGSTFRSKFLDTDELMSYCSWFATFSSMIPKWPRKTKIVKQISRILVNHLGLNLTKDDLQNVVDLMEPYGQISNGIEYLNPPLDISN